MHRTPTTSAAVLAIALVLPVGTLASASSVHADGFVDEARVRALLESGQPGRAAAILEAALGAAPAEALPTLLDQLRRAYAAAAEAAEAVGNRHEAGRYRDNLEILNRKGAGAGAMAGAAPPAPSAAPPQPGAITRAPTGASGAAVVSPEGAPLPLPDVPAPAPEAASPHPEPAPPPEAEPRRPAPAPVPLSSSNSGAAPGRLVVAVAPEAGAAASPPTSPPTAPIDPAPARPSITVEEADASFRAARYDEAGRLYAALDREGRLPASRRDHWAYCRWADVVRRINARPSTPQEWAEIDAEIERIRALSPNNWYGEYLRNRAAERPSGGRARNSNRLVVRGSAPEELSRRPSPARRADASGSTTAPAPAQPQATAPAARPAPKPSAASAAPPQRPPAGPVAWQTRETPNFRILHDDPELAEKVAVVAEATRDTQTRRWAGSAPRAPWAPKCEIYLYPTARVFSQMTGQPEDSPGFSTMGMSGGRIIARRVNLRADHPTLLVAILPHEITHVVLADLFPHQQIPRWADEGMAVLSEPAAEQNLRAADLNQPLATGQLFKIEKLMTMDYPEGRYWGLYYAQSVSLTRFLVEQGGPTQFIQFVQRAQVNGAENELKHIYNIDGFADLHQRWTAYARARSAETTAAAAKPDRESNSATR